jgi:hypothetical protein
MLNDMGNKNTGKREVKKPAKPKPKAAPGRKREEFTPSSNTPGKS